ncbi:septation protein SepH [Corynebacterium auriscanis]|uniref:septation protein SepH n=1 Tax=Corynebacterium auriscanis TaxID=99807 RepID=UPI003CEFA56B
MQELKLIVAESDASSLVLRVAEQQDSHSPATSDNSGDTASDNVQEFFLPVTDDLRLILDGHSSSDVDSAPSDLTAVTSAKPSSSDSNDASSTPSPLSTALGSLTATPSSTEEITSTDSDTSGASDEAPASDSNSTDTPTRNKDADEEGVETKKVAGFGKFGRTSQRPHRTRISITPRAIQDRVRHGASIEELAEEADTDSSRIEPYAWPILQERARIAELAHSAHPVNSDGPAKNTLWEVLATSLAARGESLSECEWDAYLNEAKQWIITVSWNKAAAGQVATHVAEFLLQQQQPGPNLAQPINSIAGDLVDPRYGQAPRRVAAVTPLRWNDDLGMTAGDRVGDYDEDRDYDNARDGGPAPDGYDPTGGPGPRRMQPRGDNSDDVDGHDTEEGFLMHPDDDDRPKRRRKAITPHWEDVLLGVRTNPRKKR